jgi:hypothetical protein
MAMHAMPTIAEAANEKIVRCDMVTVLPGLPKKAYSSSRRTRERVAPESRNLPPSVAPCVNASLI